MHMHPKQNWLKALATPWAAALLAAALLLAGCGKEEDDASPNAFIFNPVDTTFVSTTLVIPSGRYRCDTLYIEGEDERVDWKNVLAPAKGKQDFLAFIPIGGSGSHGILWVNHETTSPHDQIGDGGGASVMEVFCDSVMGWRKVGFPYAVNFEPVGGTIANCLGTLTPWGTVLTSEELEPSSDAELHDPQAGVMLRDTGWGRWSNYGWMVEVDPVERKVLGKRHAMGRFMHEGVYAMPDHMTFYLLDDEGPGAFFKFVADTAKNLRSGQLFAYRHERDSLGRHWMPLPRGRDSLVYARRHAFQRGATIFNRMEDIELLPDGSFLISETGKDSADFAPAIALGGKVPPHLGYLHVGSQVYHDKYGRLLRFDPRTDEISVYLEAGQALEDKSIMLSNPDNLALDSKRGLLVIQEDINGTDAGRMPQRTGIRSKANPSEVLVVNEIYFLDIRQPKPSLDDLHRFAVAPAGYETTGAVFSPDGDALFISLQADEPPARSLTVVVTGFKD